MRAARGTLLVHKGIVAPFRDTKGADFVEPAAELLSGRKAEVVSEFGSEEGHGRVEGFVAGVSYVPSTGARDCR